MSAKLERYVKYAQPFGSTVWRFDTLWMDGEPRDIRAPNPFAPTMDIDFYSVFCTIGKVRWTKKLFLGK